MMNGYEASQGMSCPIGRLLAGDGAPLEHAQRYLGHLYEIGKLLTRFSGTDQTLPRLVALMNEALPLRTLVLVQTGAPESGERPRCFAWSAEGVGVAESSAAEARARTSHACLVGAQAGRGRALGEWSARWRFGARPPEEGDLIALPLANEGHQVSGVLQTQAEGTLDEEGLAFLSAVANLLAVALERHDAWMREIFLRERAESLERGQRELLVKEQAARKEAESLHRRQSFLAEATALLGASLDYRATLPEVARLVVPALADCCAVEVIRKDGTLGREALVMAEPSLQLPEGFVQRVLASHPWILFPEAASREGCAAPEASPRVQLLEWAGFPSNLRVLLCARGRLLGAISFICATPGRYGPEELSLLEALGRRISMSLDNDFLYREAQEAVAWREELLATVSHDIQSPVLAIAINAQLLKDGPPRAEDAGEWLRKKTDSIAAAVAQVRGLINGLLDRARVQGKLALQRERRELAPLLDEALEVLRPLAASKALALSHEVCAGVPPVAVDPLRILQVLSNLIGNAIKFTPPGGEVAVRVKRVGQQVRVSVRDSGPGLAPEELPHLFERYWQAGGHERLGIGLGLATAKGIVEGHGGKIWVESQKGLGSTFFFSLPLAGAAPGQ